MDGWYGMVRMKRWSLREGDKDKCEGIRYGGLDRNLRRRHVKRNEIK